MPHLFSKLKIRPFVCFLNSVNTLFMKCQFCSKSVCNISNELVQIVCKRNIRNAYFNLILDIAILFKSYFILVILLCKSIRNENTTNHSVLFFAMYYFASTKFSKKFEKNEILTNIKRIETRNLSLSIKHGW